MSIRGEKKFGKRGQITVFIIIALLIVGAAVLIYFLTSSAKTKTTTGFDVNNPEGFLQTCLEDELENIVETISIQGGSLEPEFYILYEGEKVEYLCYTAEYYTTCVVQQPVLISHIKSEIKNEISDDVSSCLNSLRQSYEEKNYNVQLTSGEIEVELLPKRVALRINSQLTVSKVETQRYDSFNVFLNNNLYELASIANSIVDWETNYGDAEITIYMTYYDDLKVEKERQEDGSTVYVLTDRNTENKFQFAVRSGALPAGYGTEGIAG